MRAAVCTRYGPPEVVEVQEVDTPVPAADEVRVRVRATTVSSGDRRIRAWDMPRGFGLLGRLAVGVRRPRAPILGTDVAGEVDAVGDEVTRFAPGDEVFGATGAGFGAHAEYVCLPEDGALAAKPADVTHDQAAAIPFGGVAALYFLRDLGDVEPRDAVLVNGASGAVGTAAVQLASHFGAEVTGVSSTANLELVRSLGAADVIDYTREDPTAEGGPYDIVFDTVGTLPFSRCKPTLTPDGVYLSAVAGLPEFARVLWTGVTGGRRVKAGVAVETRDAVEFLRDRIEAGDLEAIVDRRYPLEEIAEAHRHVDTRHKRGNVVVTVDPTSDPA